MLHSHRDGSRHVSGSSNCAEHAPEIEQLATRRQVAQLEDNIDMFTAFAFAQDPLARTICVACKFSVCFLGGISEAEEL